MMKHSICYLCTCDTVPECFQ